MAKKRSRHLSKVERSRIRKRNKELATACVEALAKRKHRKNQEEKRFPLLVKALYDGESFKKSGVLSLICNHFELLRGNSKIRQRRVYRDLLLILFAKNCFGLLRNEQYVAAIYYISVFARAIRSDIWKWERPSRNERNQVVSLARYCFVQFAMPVFMDSVWFHSDHDHQNWFVEIGAGVNPRKMAGLPFQMTKKMAHLFMQAPSDLNVSQVLRYVQATSLGACRSLAIAIASSPLSRNGYDHEELWTGLIHLLCNAGNFDFRKVGEIVDFLEHELRDRPSISIKGRTIQSLVRQSDAWHVEMANIRQYGPNLTWESIELKPFLFIKGRDEARKEYRLVELLTTKELIKEGRKMGHCVGGYASYCAQKRCAIFSLREYVHGDFELRTLGTLEINVATSTIVQAKAKFNKPLSDWALKLMNSWAHKNELKINNYL